MNPERFQQVDRVLQSVLERPAEEREAFLEEACGADSSLKREVRSLLASYDDSGSFIERPAVEDGARLMADEREASLVGQTVGNYRVVSQLGAGGMGEVYLANDTRNNRPAALKILLAHLTTDAERVRRFQQEARAVLTLNHPNIVTVYDIGQADGVNFIATELIEGETLRRRMTRQPLTVGEALDVATQIASALVYAHERGVVHRDIKPENVMLRPDGYVKVLDFGIAKLTERRVANKPDDLHEARTRMQVETSPGMVMGTVHYMSPEQARGLPVDERADTWSLGCVLYEMLTGRQPFEGETPSDVIATILKHDPAPLSALVPDAPAELERILVKALDKQKDERYQTAKDFLADLRRFKRQHEREAELERSTPPGGTVSAAPGVSTGGQRASARGAGEPATAAGTGHTTSSAEYIVGELKRHRAGVLVALAALVVVVAAVGYGLYRLSGRGGAGQGVSGGGGAGALKMTPLPVNGIVRDSAISPDDKYVVYKLASSERDATFSLWVKHLPTESVVQILPPTKNTLYLSGFTADGDYVYYGEADFETQVLSLNRVPVIGGVPKKLADRINGIINFAVSPDGKQFTGVRVVGKGASYALVVANLDGTGERTLVTRGDKHEWLDGWPAWSPDGKTIACFAGSDIGGLYDTLLAVNVADGTQRQLGSTKWATIINSTIVWLPDGSGMLVSAFESLSSPAQLWHVSYPDGAARKITNDLNNYYLGGVTADGKTLLTTQSVRTEDVWVGPMGGDAGQFKQVTFTGAEYVSSSAAWTPDGRIVLLSTAGGKRTLWVAGADGGNRRQLLSGQDDDYGGAVSPDGRTLAFTSTRGGGIPHIWRVDMDGNNLRQLTSGDSEDQRARWTPDGKWIVFASFRVEGKITIYKMPAEGGEPIRLSERSLNLYDLSPDGKLIACLDGGVPQPGKTKVYLLPIEGGDPVKVLELPPASGSLLSWTADSRAVTYLSSPEGVANVWAMPLDGGKPVQLTHFTAGSGATNMDYYALSRDGKRLAVTRTNSTNSLVLLTGFK
jgi:serine/threonine protein kinase/Tol biopolymer transport system component